MSPANSDPPRGDPAASQVTGLVVRGQPVAATANLQVPLADWGTLEVLGETSSTTSTPPRAATSAVSGLTVRLIAEHGGLPAGSELVVGLATANAVAVPTPTPTPATPATPAGPLTGAGGAGRGVVPARPATPAHPVRPPPSAPKEPGHSIPGAPPSAAECGLGE